MAQEFREIGYTRAGRQLEVQSWHAQGVDLEGTEPYAVQLKKHKSYVSINTIKEIQKEGIPILITAADRQEPMAVIPWKDLKELLRLELYVNTNFKTTIKGGTSS